jgi:predicted regulator of Ras-like GTPase activity (Roadblock/LC7/MglB family)
MMFEERLQNLRDRVEGAVATTLVAEDGIRVASAEAEAEDGPDLEALAALLVARVRQLAEAQQDLDLGPLRQFSLATDRFHVLAGEVGAGYYLLLVLESGGNTGRARYELRRARLDFEGDLG